MRSARLGFGHDSRRARAATRSLMRCVVCCGYKLWSLYGAPWLQLVATGRKSAGLETYQNKPKPLPSAATGCRVEMVRRGSTVRVRQRALQKLRKWGFSFRMSLQIVERDACMEPFMEPSGRKRLQKDRVFGSPGHNTTPGRPAAGSFEGRDWYRSPAGLHIEGAPPCGPPEQLCRPHRLSENVCVCVPEAVVSCALSVPSNCGAA
jgi:hypothetical protein